MRTTFKPTPAQARLLLMMARKAGITAAEAAKEEQLLEHTIRSMVSRLRSVGRVKIANGYIEGRGTVYRAHAHKAVRS